MFCNPIHFGNTQELMTWHHQHRHKSYNNSVSQFSPKSQIQREMELCQRAVLNVNTAFSLPLTDSGQICNVPLIAIPSGVSLHGYGQHRRQPQCRKHRKVHSGAGSEHCGPTPLHHCRCWCCSGKPSVPLPSSCASGLPDAPCKSNAFNVWKTTELLVMRMALWSPLGLHNTRSTLSRR